MPARKLFINRGVFISAIFQLNHYKRKAINDQNYIRSFVLIVFGDGKLIDDKEIVVDGVFKIDAEALVAAVSSLTVCHTSIPSVRLNEFGDVEAQRTSHGFVLRDRDIKISD